MFIIPADRRIQQLPHGVASVWDRDALKAVTLYGFDRPLDHSDAAVLADGSEPRASVLAVAPAFLTLALPELRSLVADEVSGRCACSLNHLSEERTDLNRGRWLPEHGKPIHTARIMIEHQYEPMTVAGKDFRQRLRVVPNSALIIDPSTD